MNENPLVSVVVFTYNSSKTVKDTLDSIRQQTYKKIELIVSDDSSKDDTVKIVSDWLNQNDAYFVRTQLITVETNTGTVRNMNRGVGASNGSWIKSIAGDDCLVPNAVERFISFVKENPSCRFCMSDLQLFSDNGNVPQLTLDFYSNYVNKASESLESQKRRIFEELVFTGPSWFYSKSLWEEIGGFDEDYILLEEWPFAFNALMSDNRIFVINEKLVWYRVSTESVCRSRQKGLINKTLFLDKRRFFYKIQLAHYIKRFQFIKAIKGVINYERTYLKY